MKDESKYRLAFMLDKKELSLTLDDFRTIFHLPQATDNNHDSFVSSPSFLDMVPFYKNELGFTMELKTSSSFMTTSLLQTWQTLCKIFSKCLTTRVTEWDQPPLQIMQMMYCFINNTHVGYAELLWEGLHYSLHHPTSLIPYPRFTKIIISHYMNNFPKISRRARDRSTHFTPPAPVPTVDKADEMILQDTLQNVIDDSSIPRNDDQNILGTRLEPRSDKESPEVAITNNEEVVITNVVIPVNVNEEEEEITEVYELKRRKKGKIVEESRSIPFLTPIRSPRIHTDLVSSDTRKLQELTITDTTPTPSLIMVESLPAMVDKHIKEQVKTQVPKQVKVQVLVSYMYGHILHVHPAQPQTTFVPEQQYQLYLSMKADPQTPVVRPRDQDGPHDDAHPEGGGNSAKNQEQIDDYDFWTESYASDDDEVPTKQVSQDIKEEVSLTINEAKLKKITDEMLRQRCTSGDEHQYHIDQMKNFLKSDIVWESRKEILASLHPRKTTPLVQSWPEKIVLSLHKFPAIIFNDVDIKEWTSRWVNKCIKKFNPYARYGVEHWKNLHAKIFYIKSPKGSCLFEFKDHSSYQDVLGTGP
ncbi:hypothetical protein Tco_0540730 [Tanacetum coccineum]